MDINFFTSVAVPFATAMTTHAIKGAEGPSQAIDDVMALAGFGKLHLLAEKRKAVYEQELLAFKESIATGISQIPTDNLQEPDISIIGPAFEASKYYIEKEEIRVMLANIVSKSVDSEYNSKIHHSFVEIIKQLSPEDVVFLKAIKDDYEHPIATYRVSTSKDSRENNPILPLDFFITRSLSDAKRNALTIANLKRLGLVDVLFTSQLADDSIYSIYEKQFPQDDVFFKKGILSQTPICEQLAEICF